jgi:hypothetical protein
MGDTPIKSVGGARMTKADLLAYRARWQLVEDHVYAEARASTIEERWQSLNQLWHFAADLNLRRERDPESELVQQRWARLRRGVSSYRAPLPRYRQLRDSPGHYAHDIGGPLAKAIVAVVQLLARLGDQGVVIGGVAVSLVGRPRLTEDIDATVLCDLEEIDSLLQLASECGLQPRIVEVAEFAAVLEMPELWEDIAPWLS